MARSAAPITLSSRAPEISLDELTTCLAEASALLWEVKQRRDARLAALIEVEQEERRPSPKAVAL